MDVPPATTVLPEDALRLIFVRLKTADLIRAALVCHLWCRAAARALPLKPPLLGYLFHPKGKSEPFPDPSTDKTIYPAVFLPLDASSRRLSLAVDAGDISRFSITDVHLGLVVLIPDNLPKALLPRVLVIDPASRRRALLPPPPRDALPDDRWRRDRRVFGVTVLSRAHPSRLFFDAALFTVDGDRPRAWVASVRDVECAWRAMPRALDAKVKFDPFWFEKRCVHAAGNIYWHICNSNRALKLDPVTLGFSFMSGPEELGDSSKYRVGEMPEDGRLCLARIGRDEDLQIWVRGETDYSDRGWLMERRICMRKVLDTAPRLPKDNFKRMASTWLSDLDYARTGKVFIETWGCGRYSFHMETGKLEHLEMEDGKEHGHPIWAYTLAWPPAFLAPEY